MHAWIASAFGDADGVYDDRLGEQYEYDSNVQNHKQVNIGDLLFIRDRNSLQGIGRVQNIESEIRLKQLQRCPICASTSFGRKKYGDHPFRCRSGHTFFTPREETVDVRAYKAKFFGDYISLFSRIPVIELKRFNLRKSYLAIMPADVDDLSKFVSAWDPSIAPLLSKWLSTKNDELGDEEGDVQLTPDGEDYRDIAIRAIRARRGQQGFRSKLLDFYGQRCAISACTATCVLEAAHIRPYRGENDNDESNGLLLRCDLHTLFDLNRLGINPDTGRVAISRELMHTDYANFDGVQITLYPQLQNLALRSRWSEFLCAEGIPDR